MIVEGKMSKAGQSIQKDIVVSNLKGKLPPRYVPHKKGCVGDVCKKYPCEDKECQGFISSMIKTGIMAAGIVVCMLGIARAAEPIEYAVVSIKPEPIEIVCPVCGLKVSNSYDDLLGKIEDILNILEKNPFITKEFRKQVKVDKKRFRKYLKASKKVQDEISHMF